MKTVLLNGAVKDTRSDNIAELAAEFDQHPSTLLIEHNGIALHRSEWPATLLRQGDRVEFLQIAAGG